MPKLIETLKANKDAIIRNSLLGVAAVAGIIIAGALVTKKEGDTITIFEADEITVETPDTSEL